MKPKLVFNVHPKWQELLKETPQVLHNEIDEKYISKYLLKPIVKAIEDKDYLGTEDPDIFYIARPYDGTYFYYKDGKVIGAVDFNHQNYNKQTFLVPTLLNKFDKDYSNVLYKIYKLVSLKYKCGIMSGYMQSISSSVIWKKFWNNPDKYGIKEMFTIPQWLTKEDDIWGDGREFREVRIVIKF